MTLCYYRGLCTALEVAMLDQNLHTEWDLTPGSRDHCTGRT